MVVTVEYRNGIFYVDDARVVFPKDSQHQSAPVLMGLDYNSGNIVPASFTPEGKLNVGGVTIEEAEISIADVVLIGRPEDAGRQKVSILNDGAGHGALFVQSTQMATSAKQDAQSTLLTNIDDTLKARINTTTSQLKAVLDAIEVILQNQIDTKTSVLKTSIDAIDTSLLAQVDTKTSVLNTTLGTIHTAIGITNAQLDTKTSVLNASIQAIKASIDSQIDTKTSVLDASITGVELAINTQIDTKTSVLDASIGIVHTDLVSTNAKLDTANGSLGHLTDKTQETRITDGTNSVGITDVTGDKALNVYLKGGAVIEVALSHENDSVAVWGNDGVDDKVLKTNTAGQLEVDVIASVLPTGASTAGKQDTIIADLGTINTSLGTIDTTLGTIKTDTDSIATSVGSVDTKLTALTDGSQKSKVVNDSGETIGIVTKPIIVDDNPMGKQNITSIYTYYTSGYGQGKVETIKEYPTGAGGGTPAKLTTYTYNDAGKVSSIVVSDTTV